LDPGCKFKAREKGAFANPARLRGCSESSPTSLWETPYSDRFKRKEELL